MAAVTKVTRYYLHYYHQNHRHYYPNNLKINSGTVLYPRACDLLHLASWTNEFQTCDKFIWKGKSLCEDETSV